MIYSHAPLEVVSLNNPTEEDPSLIMMTTNELGTSIFPLFTHNFYIKRELEALIMDNGSQKNLMSEDLVKCLQLSTTPHITPFQVSWVQKGGPRVTISWLCVVTFTIDLF